MKVFSPSPREGDGTESRWNWQGGLRGLCTHAFYRLLLGDLWGFVDLPWRGGTEPCKLPAQAPSSPGERSLWQLIVTGTAKNFGIILQQRWGHPSWGPCSSYHIVGLLPEVSGEELYLPASLCVYVRPRDFPPRWSAKVTQGQANISHLPLPCPTDCLHRIPRFSKMEEPLVPKCDKFLSNWG